MCLIVTHYYTKSYFALSNISFEIILIVFTINTTFKPNIIRKTLEVTTQLARMTINYPMRKHYNIYFLDDFKDALKGVNSNYFGMIDQLVAAKGRIFFGTWFSTFTGFIDRMRGYRSVRDKLPGYKDGSLPTSYYYAVVKKKLEMHEYAPLHGAFFNREFPTSWRDIDKGIGELPTAAD